MRAMHEFTEQASKYDVLIEEKAKLVIRGHSMTLSLSRERTKVFNYPTLLTQACSGSEESTSLSRI